MTDGDKVSRMYRAGTVSACGTLSIEGIGARTTNWGIGATLRVCCPRSDMAAAAAIREFIKIPVGCDRSAIGVATARLTTKYDILVVAEKLGITLATLAAIAKVELHDEENGLAEIRKENYDDCGRGWVKPSLSITEVVPLSPLSDPVYSTVLDSMAPMDEDLAFNAFVEGEGGLLLGTADIKDLLEGKSILEKYQTMKTPHHRRAA